ncbi:MAG: hemagglutinin repeat-containing protein [Azonexus sp.]
MINNGTLQAKRALGVSAHDAVNTGTLLSEGNLTITTVNGYVNGDQESKPEAVTESGGTLTLDAGTGGISNEANAKIRAAVANLNSQEQLKNAGTLAAVSGAMTLRSGGGVDNSGTIFGGSKVDIADASGGATTDVTNSGKLVSHGLLDLSARKISNQAAALIEASTGTVLNTGELSNSGEWRLSTVSDNTKMDVLNNLAIFTNDGVIKGARKLEINYGGDVFTNKGSLSSSHDLSLKLTSLATDRSVVNDTNAILASGGQLTIDSAGLKIKNNGGAKMLADKFSLSAAELENSGVLQGGGASDSSINVGQFKNLTGAVAILNAAKTGNTVVVADVFTNQGALQSAGDAVLKVGELDNSGEILALKNIDVQSKSGGTFTINNNGDFQGGGKISLGVDGDLLDLNVAAGKSIYGNNLAIKAKKITLEAGASLVSEQDLNIRTQAGGELTMKASNSAIRGALSHAGAVDVDVAGDYTNIGLVYSGNTLNFSANNINNTSTGGIAAVGDLILTTLYDIDNYGQLWSGQALTANVRNFRNHGSRTAAQGRVDAGSKVHIAGNLLVNNSIINSEGGVEIDVTQLINQVEGGDTRQWGSPVRTTRTYSDTESCPEAVSSKCSGGAWNAGGAYYEYWAYTTYSETRDQYYAGGKPSFSPQITGAGKVDLTINYALNMGATIQGNDVNVTGTGFRPFFDNVSLDLQHETTTGKYYQYLRWGGVKGTDAEAVINRVQNSQTGATTISNAETLPVILGSTPSTLAGETVSSGVYASLGKLTMTNVFLTNQGNPFGSTDSSDNPGNDAAPDNVEKKETETGPLIPKSTEVKVLGADSIGPLGLGGGDPIDPKGPQGTPDVAQGGASVGGLVPAPAAPGLPETFSNFNVTLPSNPNGLFVRAKDSSARYLIETNPLYLSASSFEGSDYFARMLGFDPDTVSKRLGDGAYEAYVVKQQMLAMTGRAVMAGVSSDAQQMQLMMTQAVDQQGLLGLVWGQALTASQEKSLQKDLLWMVPTEVNGQTVLAPKVYLSQKTKDAIQKGAIISADVADLNLLSLSNTGGTINANKSLKVVSVGDITNVSGTISGGDVDLKSTSGSIVNKTYSETAGSKEGYSTTIGKQAQIAARGNLSLDAAKSITNLGADVSAGGSASLKAKDGVTFDTIEDKSKSTTASNEQGFLYSKSNVETVEQVKQIKSGLNVGGNLSIESDKRIVLAGTDANIGGDADLKAKDGVQILARADQIKRVSETKESGLGVGGGLFGDSSTKSTENVSKNVASNFNVGGNASIDAGKSDITIKGSNLNIGGDADFKAKNINILAGEDKVEKKTETTTTTFFKVDNGSSRASASVDAKASAKSGGDGASGSADAKAGAKAGASGGLELMTTEQTTTESLKSNSVSSIIKVGGDSKLKADNVKLQGSTLDTKGDLEVDAKRVDVLAAKNVDSSKTTTSTTKVGLMSNVDADAGASASSSGAAGSSGVQGSVAVKVGANAEVGLNFLDSKQKETETLNVTHTASGLSSGGKTKIVATEKLTVEGSNLASGASMTLETKELDVHTSEDVSISKTKTTNTKIGLMAKSENSAGAAGAVSAGPASLTPSASASADAGSENTLNLLRVEVGTEDKLKTRNNKSTISAGTDLTVNAQKATFVGADVQAGGDASINAKDQSYLAAVDRDETKASKNTTTAGLYVGAGAGAGAEAGINSKASASAEIHQGYQAKNVDEKSTTGKTTAVTTTIKTGGNLNRNAAGGKLVDEGSNIDVAGSLTQSANTIESKAARNTTYSSSERLDNTAKVSAYAGASAGAGMTSGAGYDASVGVRTNFDTAHSQSESASSKAVTGNVKVGKDFNSKSTEKTTFEGTKVDVGGDVDVSAKSLDFTAAKNTSSTKSRDTTAGVAVTVNVNLMSVVGGSVSAQAGTESKEASRSTDVAGSIKSGGSTKIKTQQDATFKGTSIAAGDSVDLDVGGNLNMLAAEDKSKSKSEGGGGAVSLGMSTGGKAGGGKSSGGMFEVSAQFSQSSSEANNKTAASISSGSNTNIKSQNLDLEGTKIKSGGDTTLDVKGDTKLRSAQSTSSSQSVSGGVGLSGEVNKKTSANTTETEKSATGSVAGAFGSSQKTTNDKVSIQSKGKTSLDTKGDLRNEGATISGGKGTQVKAGGNTENVKLVDSASSISLGAAAEITVKSTSKTENNVPGKGDDGKGSVPAPSAKGDDGKGSVPAPSAKGDDGKGSVPAPSAKGDDGKEHIGQPAPQVKADDGKGKGSDIALPRIPLPPPVDAKGSGMGLMSMPLPQPVDAMAP